MAAIKHSSCPAVITLQLLPFFFKYNTQTELLILSMILLPAAAPTPASAPIASDGNTLPYRNLPAVVNAGKIAPMKPHSIFEFYCSSA